MFETGVVRDKPPKIIPNLQLWNFFRETQGRVRNSGGKRAISVRAIEVLLYASVNNTGSLNYFSILR